MADTLQESLTGFRDLIYSANPNVLKSIPGFSFNRDEFIFTLIDKKTKIITKSSVIISIRVGNEDLINLKDTAGVWSLLKYDDSTLTDTDPEMIWFKEILDALSLNMLLIIGNDPQSKEYISFLNRINNNQV